ncbi:MAG: DUF2703 domain-containing protein [Bacteroidales bacterium]
MRTLLDLNVMKSLEGNVCRVIEYEGKTYETIPKEMIKEAIRKAVGIEAKSDSCCCESQ